MAATWWRPSPTPQTQTASTLHYKQHPSTPNNTIFESFLPLIRGQGLFMLFESFLFFLNPMAKWLPPLDVACFLGKASIGRRPPACLRCHRELPKPDFVEHPAGLPIQEPFWVLGLGGLNPKPLILGGSGKLSSFLKLRT